MSQTEKNQSTWSESRPTGDHGQLEATIQDGWLHAKHVDGDGQLRWHVILGRANTSALPVVKVAGGILEIRHADGRYFVRDMPGANRLSCVREKADKDSFVGIDTTFLRDAEGYAHGSGAGVGIGVQEKDRWIWVTLGPEGGGYNAVIRMTPTIIVPENSQFGAWGGVGLVEFVYDKANLTDDGEFLQARYVTWEEAEEDRNRQNLQKGTMPPELEADRWIHPIKNEEGRELKKLSSLRGKVVLLDFWATWCTPCVRNLPRVEELYRNYKDKGLVVIAIHSSINADGLDAFLEEQGCILPVLLDTGETERRYGIRGIPQYVLIGRDGRLAASGLRGHPPDKGEIEAMLGD